MIVGVLVPIAVLVALIVAGAYLFSRGKEGLDFSAPSLLRSYLYLASFAGVVLFTIGLGSAVNFAVANAVGDDAIYGSIPSALSARPFCPPSEPACANAPTAQEMQDRARAERDRRKGEDLIRGVTFAVLGGVFWLAHWMARRTLARDTGAGFWRAYLLLGAIVFGLATIVLLPSGIYQMLSNALLPARADLFRPGADSLGGGIVALPIWLVYLRLLVRDFRSAAA